MVSLFRPRSSKPIPVVEPDATAFPKIQGADLAAAFAGQRIAGDFYDSLRVSPERVLFGLLDVAGRRDEIGDLLSAAQQTFRSSGAKLFAAPDINESDVMTELSLDINRALIEASKGVASCPAFIACYHEKFGTLCYANGGHTPGLLRDPSGITELASTGLPLGLFSHATAEAPTVAMEEDSVLLLVSRGVVECGAGTEEFGLDRIKTFLQNSKAQSAQELCSSLLGSAGAFCQGAPMRDDRTCLALMRTA